MGDSHGAMPWGKGTMRTNTPALLVLGTALLLVLVGAAPAAANGDDAVYDLDDLEPGERALVKLPLEFQVPEENYLYLYGKRIEHVQLTLDPGDSLRLNGIPIYPRAVPAPNYPMPSDEKLHARYKDVPYVQALLERGATVQEAADSFEKECMRVFGGLRKAYGEALESTSSPEAAARAAFGKLADIDQNGLVDWERTPNVAGTSIEIPWKGRPLAVAAELRSVSGSVRGQVPAIDNMLTRATMIYEAMVLRRPCCCIIGSGGFRLLCGEEQVSRVRAEIAHLLATQDVKNVPALGENTALDILSAEGR